MPLLLKSMALFTDSVSTFRPGTRGGNVALTTPKIGPPSFVCLPLHPTLDTQSYGGPHFAHPATLNNIVVPDNKWILGKETSYHFCAEIAKQKLHYLLLFC